MIRPTYVLFLLTLSYICGVRSFSILSPIAYIGRSRSLNPSTFSSSFALFLSTSTTNDASSSSGGASRQKRMGELTPAEQALYDFLCELSQSKYSFRVVVVGKSGSAILESTVPSLGPVIKITQSPSTGANMATFANEDQSFEYHVQLEQISKIMLIEKETPNKKVLRIIRLLNSTGDSMSSFILADSSEAAKAWYHDLVQRRGNEIVL